MTKLIIFFGYLCVLPHGGLATGEAALQDYEHELMPDDEVALFQHSVGLTPVHEIKLDPEMSEAQILAEIKVSRARTEALEKLLSTKRGQSGKAQKKTRRSALLSTKQGQSRTTSKGTDTWALIAFPIAAFVILLLVARAFTKYESAKGKFDGPWYHDSKLMSTLLACAALLWFVLGAFFFTQVLHFTSGIRHLTLIESIFLSAQIFTTVGYGDYTIATDAGLIFMAAYVLLGVSIVATLVGNLVDTYFGKAADKADSMIKSKFLKKHLSTICILLFIFVSTLFWGLIPGEDLTFVQAFYMTIVTLTTVGFGYYTPTTPLGMAVAAPWMVVGTVFLGHVLSDFSSMVIDQRQTQSTKASAMKYFEKVTKASEGRLDRIGFLSFEMIRSGQQDDDITKAMSVFDGIDTSHREYLDIDEFRAYVKLIYGDEASK
mmetsp:Transcript_12270/g.21320  ORF Transcript_12270/g.21320 Transcript_12270/m.21320 type:complete len:432 (+) Transcript_12270:32-1327(+)